MLVDKEGFCRERTFAKKRILARPCSPKSKAGTCRSRHCRLPGPFLSQLRDSALRWTDAGGSRSHGAFCLGWGSVQRAADPRLQQTWASDVKIVSLPRGVIASKRSQRCAGWRCRKFPQPLLSSLNIGQVTLARPESGITRTEICHVGSPECSSFVVVLFGP